MQQIIEELAQRHGIELGQAGVSLTLTRQEQPDVWLLYNAGADHVVFAYLVHDPEGQLFPEVEFLFFIDPQSRLKLVEIRYSFEAWSAYMDAARTQRGHRDSPNNGEDIVNRFGAYWVGRFAEEAWLTVGQAYVRLSGCQSTNHTQCYGELWQCALCQRTFCWAEGTDNHPELCDDCWAAQFAPEAVVDMSRGTFTAESTLTLPCNCLEECGAWLELTPDGRLAIEDSNGLRVSLLLPVWLDTAIRQAAYTADNNAKESHAGLND